jgi:hypothetical protein
MRGWLRWLGLTVVCVAAVVASFSTLASLAEFTGWVPWTSWLLPLCLDALGMTACLVWLDPSAPKGSRRYAAWMTWVAAGLSVLGNGAGHLASTGHLNQGLLLVVLVGSVPPATVSVTVHLIVSASAPSRPVRVAAPALAKVEDKPKATTVTKPKPSPSPVVSGPESGPVVDDVLLQRARHADRTSQQVNQRPVRRDELKELLKVGTRTATDLLNVLKKEREVA